MISRLLLIAAVILGAVRLAAAGEPQGKVTVAWHVTISPAWFDPSTAPPQITPFGMLYAIHDALVRPYPGQKMGPSLAKLWKESPDGKTYEFKLRPGLKFHNGDPITTEDVKFSFERYKGASAALLHDRVSEVEIVDPQVVRFHLKEPWPDFMTFYGTTASAAGIVRAEELSHPGRRRRVPQASGRRRPLQVRPPQAGRRGRAGGLSRLLAPRSQREDPDHAQRSRGDHARGHGEDRRGRLRAGARRTGRRGHPARSAHAGGGVQARLDLLDRVHRAMGPQVALARPAAAAGGQPGARSPADQRGGLPRLLPAGGRDRAARHGLRAAGRAAALRPGQGQEAARRSRLSQRHRCRRVRRHPRLPDRRRGGGERPQRRRHPRPPALDGARRLLRRLAGEEAARPVHDRRPATPATPPAASTRSSSPRAPTPTAAIPTSTIFSASRRRSATPRSARPCCTRSSSSRSTG